MPAGCVLSVTRVSDFVARATSAGAPRGLFKEVISEQTPANAIQERALASAPVVIAHKPKVIAARATREALFGFGFVGIVPAEHFRSTSIEQSAFGRRRQHRGGS